MQRAGSESLELGPVMAERTFTLFRRNGSAVAISVRLGRPFVGARSTAPAPPEYRCGLQILGIGDERVIAPWGEDPFVALQYAIDLIGQRLDALLRSENLATRFYANNERASWIWRYPPQ